MDQRLVLLRAKDLIFSSLCLTPIRSTDAARLLETLSDASVFPCLRSVPYPLHSDGFRDLLNRAALAEAEFPSSGEVGTLKVRWLRANAGQSIDCEMQTPGSRETSGGEGKGSGMHERRRGVWRGRILARRYHPSFQAETPLPSPLRRPCPGCTSVSRPHLNHFIPTQLCLAPSLGCSVSLALIRTPVGFHPADALTASTSAG